MIDKLDYIISDFASVEFGMESLLITLKVLEELYDIDRNMELKAFLNVTIRNIESLREDMRKSINDLDDYMMGHYNP